MFIVTSPPSQVHGNLFSWGEHISIHLSLPLFLLPLSNLLQILVSDLTSPYFLYWHRLDKAQKWGKEACKDCLVNSRHCLHASDGEVSPRVD